MRSAKRLLLEEKLAAKLTDEVARKMRSGVIQPMNVLKVDDLQWYEIDDIDDLRYAEDNIKI